MSTDQPLGACRPPTPAAFPPSGPPVASVDEAIARMQAIAAALPPEDGLACFNRMYLQVTLDVGRRIHDGFFADAPYMTKLDVVFANLYFEAVNGVAARRPEAVPKAWRPLVTNRLNGGIEPIQFALAGMNTHINYDLPNAVVQTCAQLGTSPDAGSHHADYEKVNQLLDAAEQGVRQSFEDQCAQSMDRHFQGVLNVIGNWSINAAREVAWDTANALWAMRDLSMARNLLLGALARTVAMAGRGLLVVV